MKIYPEEVVENPDLVAEVALCHYSLNSLEVVVVLDLAKLVVVVATLC